MTAEGEARGTAAGFLLTGAGRVLTGAAERLSWTSPGPVAESELGTAAKVD